VDERSLVKVDPDVMALDVSAMLPGRPAVADVAAGKAI
jgi:hypothetical protein